MGKEIKQNAYYESTHEKWLDIHKGTKVCLLWWLTKLLMKNDPERVQYCMPDVVFRRRMELVDKGRSKTQPLTPVSLNLPFASIYQEKDWEADDRMASSSLSEMLIGQIMNETGLRIRATAVKADYHAQVFYNRRDDTRLAQQLLYWEGFPKHPVRLFAYYGWKNKVIPIPSFVTINSIDTKPNWEERKALESQKIFPIEISMTVRSYQVYIHDVDNIITLPIRFNNYDDDDTVYLTEQTILDFGSWAYHIDLDLPAVQAAAQGTDLFYEPPETKEIAKKFYGGEFTKEQLDYINKYTISEDVNDMINGYLGNGDAIKVNYFEWNKERTTTNSVWIDYEIDEGDYENFDHLNIMTPGHQTIVVDDPSKKCAHINDLCPNSEYLIRMVVYSTNGDIQTLNLSATTKEDPKSEAPTPKKINKKYPGLVGKHI